MAHFADLLESARSAKRDMVLVAPFIKEAVISGLLAVVEPGVTVVVVTRWRPDEILSGVSDVEVHRIVARRRESGRPTDFRLLDPVHAKYYRFDDSVFVGSANLTATGLGIYGEAVEILLEVDRSPVLLEFEDQVLSRSVQPSVEVIRAFEDLAVQTDPARCNAGEEGAGSFFPAFRDPTDLWCATTDDSYPSPFREAALADVRALCVPSGLSGDQFRASIAAAFGASPLVRELRFFCSQPRRFGEVRHWVTSRTPVSTSPTMGAQTLLRWLAEFLPNEFSVRTANYSEILVRHPLPSGLTDS